MYNYGRFTLLRGRNEHNIVKKLSSNWKEREKKVYSIFMVLILIESFPLSLNNVKEKETEES